MKSKDERWCLLCPQCKAKTEVLIKRDTVLLKFPLKCPQCGKETIVNVVDGKMTTEKS